MHTHPPHAEFRFGNIAFGSFPELPVKWERHRDYPHSPASRWRRPFLCRSGGCPVVAPAAAGLWPAAGDVGAWGDLARGGSDEVGAVCGGAQATGGGLGGWEVTAQEGVSKGDTPEPAQKQTGQQRTPDTGGIRGWGFAAQQRSACHRTATPERAPAGSASRGAAGRAGGTSAAAPTSPALPPRTAPRGAPSPEAAGRGTRAILNGGANPVRTDFFPARVALRQLREAKNEAKTT